MNEHAGPACALSGLIVSLFAVLLHDRNPPPPAPKRPNAQAAASTSVAPPPSEASAAIQPPPVSKVETPPSVRQLRPDPTASPLPRPKKRVESSESSRPIGPGRAEKRPAPPTPRSAFAMVGPGESLRDVAQRVYGSDQATEVIWKANRDQVERVDSPLNPGTLLRTP